jgi:ATP-dependent RNA helicase RhlE
MTFEELNLSKSLLNALDDLGYITPTTIQQKVFSVMLSGKDVCGLAQTGTGKTLAYLLPSLRLHQFSKEKLPQILILVPTRELVVQVEETVNKLAKYMNLRTVGVYGGSNIKPQIADLMQGADVVVGTPGRLIDLALKGALKLKGVKRLVIDEVDEMMNLGFRTQLNTVLDLLPPRRQNLLFSATMTAEVETLIAAHFNAPVLVEAAPTGTPLENITQLGYYVPNFYTKINFLKQLLSQTDMARVLVFVATKHQADLVFEEIEGRFRDCVGVIHSNKAQNHRFNVVRQFQEGTCRILIATDIIARGLDIAGVSHVINFDIPDDPESYIHRIGRTGRADQTGVAICLVTEREKEPLAAIEALMKYIIPVTDLPVGVEVSEVLTPDEQPKVQMKNVLIKVPRPEEGGGAFHEKIDKNKKVNVRRNHKEEKMLKYGRPIKKTRKKRGEK